MPNPSWLPAKPSEAGSPGRGGARKRTQFSPLGGNGVEWTLRRRAAMGKVGRRPQAAKSPMKRSPLRSGHRVVAQASFFDPAGQFTFSHPAEKPPPLSACYSQTRLLQEPEHKIKWRGPPVGGSPLYFHFIAKLFDIGVELLTGALLQGAGVFCGKRGASRQAAPSGGH